MTPLRFAFAGFRHGHIMALLAKVNACPEADLVAACEEDPATREQLAASDTVAITHQDAGTMLDTVACDAVAIGDVFGKRGALAIAALQAGRHVIVDKPLCTRLGEWEIIRDLAIAKGLSVGCMLDMRDDPPRQTMRHLILNGDIGTVQTVVFSGQHPLMLGSRPGWYFESGSHGGTLNDIAIHALDCIPWMTGRKIAQITAARTWNAKAVGVPWFKDCAQLMLTLDNGGGILGDVSYLSPDACGYSIRPYWRLTVHGTRGVAETQCGDPAVMLATDTDKQARSIPGKRHRRAGYFEDFLAEVQGCPEMEGLTTASVLEASRWALLTQKAADEGLTCVPPLGDTTAGRQQT